MMRRALSLAAAVSCLLASTVLSATAPAAADQLSDKRAEAKKLSDQLAAQGDRVSVLAEQYNAARLESDRLEQRLADATAKIKTTDDRAGALRSRLKGQAVESFMRGGSAPALAMLADTKLEDDIAIRKHYVTAISNQVSDTLDELHDVKATLEEQRDALAKSRAAAKSAVADVERRRNEAAAAQAAQEKLLAKVQGEVADLVAAEQKRKADAEAARMQAELSARRAREEASAREAASRRSSPTTAAPSTGGARSTTTTVPRSSSPSSTNAPPPSSGAQAAVAEAQRQLGKPYEYGGAGPDSFDCSGLTAWAWRAGGKSLPHSSQAQWSATSRVAIEDLAPGDILFYGSPIHHVGIYVGDGTMIEAPETGKTVRYASIYRRDLVGAGRVN